MKNASAAAGTWNRVVRPCVGLALAGLLLATVGIGCGEGNSKKSRLTPEEIERLTYAPAPVRPDQLMVSGEAITCDDILSSSPEEGGTGPTLRDKLFELAAQTTVDQFLTIARPQVLQRLNGRITNIVLSRRAQRELGDNIDENLDKLAEQELRRYILEEHGGNAVVAEESLKKVGMTRSEYLDWKKKQILAQYVVSSRFPRNPPVTRRELIAQYEQMKDPAFVQEGLLQFRLIDLQIARVELDDPSENPIEKARKLAEELRRRIDAGEDFAELAKQYSHGHRSEQGGLWRPRDPDALAAPYDTLARRAGSMEPGQVAGPIEEDAHVFIMKLEEKQEAGYRPLSEVQEEVRRALLEGRRDEAVRELEQEIARQAAVVDTSAFVDYCLESIYYLANEPTARR